MEQLAILLFDLLLCSGYLVLGFILFMLIQLISYRVFKFNLYKKIMYVLIDRYVR